MTFGDGGTRLSLGCLRRELAGDLDSARPEALHGFICLEVLDDLLVAAADGAGESPGAAEAFWVESVESAVGDDALFQGEVAPVEVLDEGAHDGVGVGDALDHDGNNGHIQLFGAGEPPRSDDDLVLAGLAGPDDERFQNTLLAYGVAELGYVAHLFAGVNGGREETVGGKLSGLETSRRGGDHGKQLL